MAKTYGDVVTLMRRIVGENDGDDPDATDDIFLGYVSDFVSLIMGQDIKTDDLWSWFEFDTVVGQDIYAFKDQGYTNIMPPAFVTDSNNGDTRLRWFQNPSSFFEAHPINVAAEQNGRPFDLLFYNNQITLRPAADAVYAIKIRAYIDLPEVTDGTTLLNQDYYLRYIAYGASLDYFADYANYEDHDKIYPIFRRYRALVLNRKAKQEMNTRAPQAL